MSGTAVWPKQLQARFAPFDLVYLRANGDMCGSVKGLLILPGCPVQYFVTWGEDGSDGFHWEGELTSEKEFGPARDDEA